MKTLLVYALTLFAAVLGSRLAARTAASSSVLFIAVGAALGSGGLGWLSFGVGDHVTQALATAALLAVLFTDGMRVGVPELRQAWALPGRALMFGLPLTLALTAVAARALLGLDWATSLLVGAVLVPTDPVFAAAIVEREEVPKPLRRLLNVESGMNDGLALPIVLLLLGLSAQEPQPAAVLGAEVLAGIALGLVLPWVAARLVHDPQRIVGSSRPLYAAALGLMLYALARMTNANEYLATFVGGASIATCSATLRDSFHPFGEHIGQALKLAALLAFGAMLHPARLLELGWREAAFVAAALFMARPVGLLLALSGSAMDWRHRLAAAWFGPKGFASLLYAMLVLHAGHPEGARLFHLFALVIATSIVLHSSTDVPMARWLSRLEPRPGA